MDSARRTYAIGSDRLFLGAFAVILSTYVLEGPIRWALIALHAEMVIYFRDAVMFGVIVIAAFSSRRGRGALPLLGLCSLLLCHLVIGVITLPTVLQALMGAKIFLPLVYGVACAPLLLRHTGVMTRLASWAFGLTVVGLVSNAFVRYPWIGASYETALMTVETSRAWAYEGVQRLPGFTRASIIAAQIILLTFVPLLSSGLRWSFKLMTTLVAAVAIVLTTTKGALTGFAAVLALEGVWRIGGRRLWCVAMVALSCVCLALPLVGIQVRVNDADVAPWQLSFVERMQDMWPRAVALFDDPFQILWGRGLGGIGMAQRLGEPTRYNAADSLMLYILLTFGILGLIYVAYFVAGALRYVCEHSAGMTSALVRGWMAIWFSVGFTTSMIEDLGTEVAIGLAIGLVFNMHALAANPLAALSINRRTRLA